MSEQEVKTTTKKPRATKAAADKPAVKATKKPAVKKTDAAEPLKTEAKTAAPKKAKAPAVKKVATEQVAAAPRSLTPEERYRMVETAAYFIAERHGFNGNNADHWIAAEVEISQLLGD